MINHRLIHFLSASEVLRKSAGARALYLRAWRMEYGGVMTKKTAPAKPVRHGKSGHIVGQIARSEGTYVKREGGSGQFVAKSGSGNADRVTIRVSTKPIDAGKKPMRGDFPAFDGTIRGGRKPATPRRHQRGGTEIYRMGGGVFVIRASDGTYDVIKTGRKGEVRERRAGFASKEKAFVAVSMGLSAQILRLERQLSELMAGGQPVSERTLKAMDSAMENFHAGRRSKPVDLQKLTAMKI